MHCFDFAQVLLKWFLQPGRQNSDAVFVALPVADDDLVVVEIYVFDAEPEALEEAEARAVEETCHDPVDAMEVGEDETDFFAGEDDGEAFWFFGAGEVIEPGERLLQDFAVKKEERSERLVLCRGSDVPFDGQVGEELGGVQFAQLFGVTFAVEYDVFSYPSDVCFFGSEAVVFTPANRSDLVQKLRLVHACSSTYNPYRV